jgi:hypothetical protein
VQHGANARTGSRCIDCQGAHDAEEDDSDKSLPELQSRLLIPPGRSSCARESVAGCYRRDERNEDLKAPVFASLLRRSSTPTTRTIAATARTPMRTSFIV